MKIVDIEPMLAFLDDNHDEKDWMVNQYNADWIYSWLESQPTISPDSLVKRGRWLNEPGRIPRCSVCMEYSDDADTGKAICCPFCGALMED